MKQKYHNNCLPAKYFFLSGNFPYIFALHNIKYEYMGSEILNVESTKQTDLPKVYVENLEEVGEKIRIALDGRPQRWLSVKTMIPESDLSKKMNGRTPFFLQELMTISRALNVEFIIGPDSPPALLH